MNGTLQILEKDFLDSNSLIFAVGRLFLHLICLNGFAVNMTPVRRHLTEYRTDFQKFPALTYNFRN